MEIEKLKKIIYGNKNVSVQHLKQFSAKLTEETTNTSVVSDLPKLIPVVFKYAVHEDKKFRESALPALTELAGLLDLNKHLKEKPWWTDMKGEILKSVDVLMNLVSTGDDQWAPLWITTVMMLGSDLRSELTLLNRLLKVVEKAFKMNDEEVRHQGFECWCKLIDNFSINKQEINNKRRLALLVIPLKANNHNTPRLCASKMKTWKHLLSKLDQHSEMTVQLLVTHFLEFMFSGVGSIPPACKTLNVECANVFVQMLQTPLLFRILPNLFIKHAFVCIEHVHRDLPLCTTIWEGLLDNMKSNQWTEAHISELMVNLFNASKSDKLGKSKTFAYMIRTLYSGNHALPNDILVKHLKTVLLLALEPHVLVNCTEEWCNELLNIVAETDPIQLPPNIIGDIITKLNVLAVSELFRDEKLKFLRGMWMTMTNIICKWMADDGQICRNGTEESDLQNIHQLLFFGAAPLSSTWNKLQMKSWKSLYSECVKYFSLSTEVKCEKFVSDLVELLLEGVKDKKIPLHVVLDLVSIILEFHLTKDESSILPLMMEVAASTINSFQTDTTGTSALLNQYLKILLVAARNEPALVNDIMTVTDKMLTSLEETPLVYGQLEKTRNAILKTQIQLNALKPCRSQDKSESPGASQLTPATSPTMTSFMHRLAKSKETKSKVSSPTPSQSSDVSSSPSHTPNSKKVSSPFCDMKSEHFVFVPPKPRKILLTDHQKENLTKRKHDIPALYQDLSQDSSQSAFESIVTPVQGVDKEQKMEKETTLHSPQSFKEVNFRRLSPRKSVISNLSSSTLDDKLQNNKENDCVNNNKKYPAKSNAKEIQICEVAGDASLKVLQEDQKRIQEHIPENDEISKVIPANTRLRSRKSSASDSSSNLSLTDTKENTKTASSDLHNHDEGTESGCDEATKYEALIKDDKSIDEANPNANHNDMEMTVKDTAHDVTTPRHSGIEVKTSKRSLRKNKLSISVEKSAKKNVQRNKQEEQNDKDKTNLSLTGSGIKSPSSSITPKVSPRRLRKRKSGVTPVLSGGDFIKKKRQSQSPFNSKDTPTNKSVLKNETPINPKHENVSKNDSLDLNDEWNKSIKKPVENEENNKDFTKCKLRSGSDKSKPASKSEIEKTKSTTTNHIEEIATKSTLKITENKSKVVPGNKGDEIEVVAIVETQAEQKLSSNIAVKNKLDLKTVDNECKSLSSKSLISLKDGIPIIDISCSPVKVVVERLPDIIISANQFEMQEEAELSCESTKKVDKKKVTAVRNITQSLFTSNHDINSNNVNVTSNVQSANSDGKVVAGEGNITLHMLDTSALNLDETCNKRKNNDFKGELNDSNNIKNKESIPSKNEGSEDKKFENDNRLIGKVNSESTDINSSRRKKRSMDKTETSLGSEKCNGEINSKNLVDNGKYLVNENEEQNSTDIKSTLDTNLVDSGKYLVNQNKEQDSTNVKKTPVKKTCSSESITLPSVSASKPTETSNSPFTSSKPKSSENTPVKSGQKQLKQTQLPFTPIRKQTVASESDLYSEPGSSEEQNPISNSDGKEGKSPFLVLVKMGTPEIKKVLHIPKSQSENTIDLSEPTLDYHRTDNELNQENPIDLKEGDKRPLSDNKSETRQEVQRTPEKANSSNTMVVCLQRTEVEVVEKSNLESPSKIAESEDIIASSQETDVTTQSILLSYRNSSSSNSCKLLSKSPKKCENPSQIINSSERVLRSSPSKTDNPRFTGTPIKKSVCRRLDVEIEESPDFNEVDSLPTSTEEKSVNNKNSEELSNDFKLLNGDSESNKNVENNSFPSSRVTEIINNIENHSLSSDCSPRSHKNLKRFAVETDASSVGSPKRTMGSLKLESNGSPMSSPNSRTSQMMELAKQETERTMSSPITSGNKRRILPIRVGPVTRTLKCHLIQRTHSGSSEAWVRRTYSPTASPNSSILKRQSANQPISPDCSPPSSKKKRVSFLDPPVSESLLFSKANPGKGQIQRPEPKLDTDSEELPSQGSVGVELAETSNSEARVFSPLKQCSSPLADILERIVNVQWMSELEAQLERLGVTTVGELSSLPDETVQRLPFIPPKLERLRKILQNYYNEMNEKSDDTRPICPEISQDECLTPEKDSPEVLIKSPEKTVEDPKPQIHETTCLESSAEDISSIAENIKNKIEQSPELVSELGNKLHIDIVMKLLSFAVCKLKKENDKS